MENELVSPQDEQYPIELQSVTKPRAIDIIIVVFGCIVSVLVLCLLCWLTSETALFSNGEGLLLVAAIWTLYNYFFGRSLTRIMQTKSENYIQKAYLALIVIQIATLIIGGILGFTMFMTSAPVAILHSREAIIPFVYFLATCSSAYFAVGHYKPKILQKQNVDTSSKILPRSAFTKPQIVTIILSLAFALFIMIYPNFWASMSTLQLILVQALLIPWWLCSYDAGIALAKWSYKYIVNGPQIVAYIRVGMLHVLPIVILAIMVICGASSDIVLSQATIDACNCGGLITVLEFILAASIIITIGYLPAYIGAVRYCWWVKKYQIPSYKEMQ